MIEQISHYKILRKIGSGGMGEVYFAEDERLGRKVALKILPSNGSGDRRNLNRFLQEARLAANLNHPNICTIYEVAETEDTPHLAMELVEGETLSDKIKFSKLEIFEILQIAAQIADALNEAHRGGIIHRDIKASNIIINRRGQVKILDFGLAKKTVSEEVTEEEITRAKTEDGMLVGTVRYMSPEQALGKKLDGRTDLWSLGVLLYEMTCGIAPFKAETHAGIFDEILNKKPIPPGDLAENIPEEFERIILKLLEKDVETRYQTASDLLADIKRLRRKLGESFSSSEIIPASSFEFRKSRELPVYKNPRRAALFSIAAILILSAVIFALYKFVPQGSTALAFAEARPVRVTNSGKILDATVSGDGKYIAYILNEGEKQSLWLKQTGNGGNAKIISDENVIFQGIKISPDGNWLYYNVWDKKSVGQIFRVPVLGGIPEKVVYDCMPGLTISPDNKKIVFVRSDDAAKNMKLVSADIGGKDETVIYQSGENKGAVFSAAFAPDGKSLAVVGYLPNERNIYSAQIAELPAEGGDLKPIWNGGEQDFGFASSPQWLPDKSGLLISLASGEIYNQLWLINYADGSKIPVGNDLNSYDSLSVTSDGKSFVGVQREFLLSIWTFPAAAPEKAKLITEGKIEGVGLDWTPGGEIFYSSTVNGKFNLWKMRADGTEKTQITNNDDSNRHPCVSFDGKITFYFSNKGVRHIGGSEKIFSGEDWKKDIIVGIGGECMRSENSIMYLSKDPKYSGLIKLNLETGEKVPVLEKNIQQAMISPDGRRIFYSFWDEKAKRLVTELLNLETKEVKPLTIPESAINTIDTSRYIFQWTPDSRAIAYIDDRNGVSNIWIQPIDGGKPKQLTDFKDNFIHSFSYSRDGSQIAVSRGTVLSDVVMFKTAK